MTVRAEEWAWRIDGSCDSLLSRDKTESSLVAAPPWEGSDDDWVPFVASVWRQIEKVRESLFFCPSSCSCVFQSEKPPWLSPFTFFFSRKHWSQLEILYWSNCLLFFPTWMKLHEKRILVYQCSSLKPLCPGPGVSLTHSRHSINENLSDERNDWVSEWRNFLTTILSLQKYRQWQRYHD